ncbi:MAG: PrsW family intramembrane metalloprotease [Spirochaetales bacterium]|nr:PrsW family intramembrane metalloprotease [Spirochaetales bacterium]
MAFFLAFLSILPLALLLGRLCRPDYRPAILWLERFLRSKRSPLGSGVLAGLIAGLLAALQVQLVHYLFWSDIDLEFRPSSAVSWTLQLAFLRASLTEELFKCSFAFAAMWLVCYRGGRYRASAPVLAAATGTGFALLENIGYFTVFGGQGLLALFVGRFFFAATAHTLSNLIFGLWFYRQQERPWRAFISGTFLAILGHGIYDFFAFAQAPLAAFLVFLTLVILGFLAVSLYQAAFPWRRTPKLQRREGKSDTVESQVFLDSYARLRPAVVGPRLEQFPLDAVTMQLLLCDQALAESPTRLVGLYKSWQERLRPFSVEYWDTGSLSAEADYHGLLRLGIDLTALSPLRIACIRRAEGTGYLSVGLSMLHGSEVYIAMPGSFPTVKLFFLALASGLKLPGLYCCAEIPSAFAGDPHGWIASFVPVPLSDDLLSMAAGRETITEILFYSRPETHYIQRHGWPALLKRQQEKGISWHNDFTRSLP